MNKTICNMCGKEFDMWDNQEGFGFSYYVGYGSKHDTEDIQCDLCCACFDKLLDEYLIPKCKHSIVNKRHCLQIFDIKLCVFCRVDVTYLWCYHNGVAIQN